MKLTPIKEALRPAIRHKYNATKTECDGIKFDSKLEAKYYGQLKLLKASGQLVQFLRQVPFYLPGGVRYVVDFQLFWADGRVEFVDVKGVETREFLTKKKMVEAEFAPITITVVKKV